MTPAAIIRHAQEDGVTLALSAAGTIKATGNGDAVNRWLPLIREHKPGVLAALQESANDDTLPDLAAEARRQRGLAMLAEKPGVRYALVPDTDVDPGAVIVALAIRGVGTCELRIPREKFDPFALLEVVERQRGTLH